MSDLPGPPEAAEPSAQEVLRAWLIGDALYCSLNAGTFEDAGSWGVLLAEVARNVASALQEADGIDPAATLAAIRNLFNQELDQPEGETPPASPAEGA
jgi:hypothetical protein